jgi:hypothetical protein
MGLDVGHIAGVHYLLDVLDECLETCVASGTSGEMARQGSRVLTAGLDCLYGAPPARGLHAPSLAGQVSPTIR